jgi:hypothetical protein
LQPHAVEILRLLQEILVGSGKGGEREGRGTKYRKRTR